MNKDKFEQWLIKNEHKKENTAYSYKLAIPYLSEHYSKSLGHAIDLFNADAAEVQKAAKLYWLDGIHADYGNKGNGTYRSALNALLRMKMSTLMNSKIIDNLIKKAIASPRIQELINDNKYYFQYLLDVKDKFFNYEISESDVEKVTEDYEDFNDGTYEHFVLNSNDSIKPFLEILAEYISYLDSKASGKNRWNKYQDKRTIAHAAVRQHLWVKYLLKLKLNPNLEYKGSIKNAIEYSISPIDNLTVLSENHRESLSNKILKRKYNEYTFQQEIIEYFKPFGIAPKNSMNYTYIISSILYTNELKSIWNQKEKEEKMNQNIYTLFGNYLKNEGFKETSISTYSNSVKNIIPSIWNNKYKTDFNPDDLSKPCIEKLIQITKRNYDGNFKGKQNFRLFLNTLLNVSENIKNKMPLNQIFFGPPGTGKTYKILSEYMNTDIVKEKKADDSKIFINENSKFWHLAPGESGYLWEQLKSQDYLGYEWCDKNLGDLNELLKDVDSYDMKSRLSKVRKGDYLCVISGKRFYAIAEALHDYDYAIASDSEFDFQTIKVNWIKQFNKPELLNAYSTQSFSKLNGSKRWGALIETLENQDIYFLSKKGSTLKKIEKNYSLVSFHQSFSYEDFIEGIKPDLNENDEDSEIKSLSYIIQDGIFKTACDKAANLAGYEDLNACLIDTKENRRNTFNNAKPFYLLIDEINRGNISAIFGELITLLEDDKRLGGEHELTIDLPYSKKPFGVPKNLYLVATMNTADRSVEALDTALRRRFSFVEVIPDTNILKDAHPSDGVIEYNSKKINLINLLDTINGRLELLIDKDHKIGHSYFINVLDFDDLIKTFKDKVIPLLEEYFYGDFGKIGLVLGKAFIEITKKENKAKLAKFDHEDKDILIEKKLYCFTLADSWNSKSFQSIYDTSVVLDE